jgi:hypothetical protein
MTRALAFVLGYHGCDKAVGERVLAGGEHLKASDNDYDWLGTGIYFWENSAERALEWARFAKANPKFTRTKISEPFAVGAIIDLGNCLDLLEAESIRTVERGYREFKEGCEILEIDPPRNKKVGKEVRIRYLDCAVINFLHGMREEEGEPAFDTVRAAFIEGAPLYENAGFHERTHIQICVRKPEQIIGYFRPIGVC